MEKIYVETGSRKVFIDITEKVEKWVKGNGEGDGVLYIYVPHTTCGMIINENADPSVPYDVIKKFEELVPQTGNYSHMEGNSDSHILSCITGNSLNVFVEKGGLQLGTWQGIFLCEFDGPRRREVWLKFIKNA